MQMSSRDMEGLKASFQARVDDLKKRLFDKPAVEEQKIETWKQTESPKLRVDGQGRRDSGDHIILSNLPL